MNKVITMDMLKKMLMFASFALFIAVFIPSVLAEANSTIELTKDIYAGDSFSFKEEVYAVNINDYDEVIFSYGDKFLIVQNNTCKKKDNYYEFCIDDITYETSKNKIKGLLRVLSYEPKINVKKTVSKNTLLVGENSTVVVTLENKGYYDAENVTYTETFPTSVNVSRVLGPYDSIKVIKEKSVVNEEGVAEDVYTVFWQGDVRRDESIVFAYRFTPKKPMEELVKARVHYFKGYKYVDEYATAMNIKADHFIEINLKIVERDYEPKAGAKINSWEDDTFFYVGKEDYLIIDIINKNTDNRSINMTDLRLFLPDGIIYEYPESIRVYDNQTNANRSYFTINTPLTKINDNVYNWSGIITKDGRPMAFRIQAAKKGLQEIKVLADFLKDSMPPVEDFLAKKAIEVDISEIRIDSNFKEGNSFNSGKLAYFTLYLSNPNIYANFTDLNVTMDIPWIKEKSMRIKRLEGSNYTDIINANVLMPTVTGQQAFKFSANVSYSTMFGERYSEELKRSIVIKPVSSIEVTHLIGSKEIKGSSSIEMDNESEVILKLKNVGQKDLESVSVREKFNLSLNKEGEFMKKISLRKDLLTDVYQYKIYLPEIYEKKNFSIRTEISYSIGNETYDEDSIIIVAAKPKTLDINAEKKIYETIYARGQTVHAKYILKNTEKETLENITVYFPTQYETDVVGKKSVHVDKILPGESVILSNEESIRLKVNGSFTLEGANITFQDRFDNNFNGTSNTVSLDAGSGVFDSPALFINRTAPASATEGDNVTVNLTVVNKGAKPVIVTVSEAGNSWLFNSVPGITRSFTYNLSTAGSGFVDLPITDARYSYEGKEYYTTSNRQKIYLRPKTGGEEKISAVEIPENITQAQPEEKARFNTKYIYIAVFIIISAGIIILFLSYKPKREGGVEFLEK